MTGCIFKRKLSSGIAWGYSFFAGRDENGKRIRIFRSAFPTKVAAERACKNAIEEHERWPGRISREVGTRAPHLYDRSRRFQAIRVYDQGSGRGRSPDRD